MFLLKTVEPEQATGSVAKIYSAFTEKVGEVPLPLQLLSASPGLQGRQVEFMGYYMSHPTLSFPLLTAIRYVAAQLSCHAACVAFNGTLLRRLGMSQEDVEQLPRGGSGALEEREAAMLKLVRQALSAPATVSADHVESVRRLGWTDGDILDAVSHGANLVGFSLVHQAFFR